MSMTIAVDFDHVLFDSSGFYEQIPVDPDDFKDTFETVYLENGKEYRIRDHVRKLNQHPEYDVSPTDLEELYGKAPQYLRRDGLQELTDRYDVVIATRATHQGWQRQKVTASGADRYVEDVIVVQGEPTENPKTVTDADVLIDDRQYEHANVDMPGYRFDEEEDTFDDMLQEVQLITDGGPDRDER